MWQVKCELAGWTQLDGCSHRCVPATKSRCTFEVQLLTLSLVVTTFVHPKAAASVSGLFLVGKSSWWFLPGVAVKEGLTRWSVRCPEDAQDIEKTQIFCGLVGSRQVGICGGIKRNPKPVSKTPEQGVGFGNEPIRNGKSHFQLLFEHNPLLPAQI